MEYPVSIPAETARRLLRQCEDMERSASREVMAATTADAVRRADGVRRDAQASVAELRAAIDAAVDAEASGLAGRSDHG